MELILAHSNVSLYLGSANESASLLYALAWGYYRKHFPHQNIYSHSSTLVHVIIRVCWPDKNLEQKLSSHFKNHFKFKSVKVSNSKSRKPGLLEKFEKLTLMQLAPWQTSHDFSWYLNKEKLPSLRKNSLNSAQI